MEGNLRICNRGAKATDFCSMLGKYHGSNRHLAPLLRFREQIDQNRVFVLETTLRHQTWSRRRRRARDADRHATGNGRNTRRRRAAPLRPAPYREVEAADRAAR